MSKFQIPHQSTDSTSKTIRFPEELIEEIERSICKTGCTFTGFVLQAVQFALQSLEEQRLEQEGTQNPSAPEECAPR